METEPLLTEVKRSLCGGLGMGMGMSVGVGEPDRGVAVARGLRVGVGGSVGLGVGEGLGLEVGVEAGTDAKRCGVETLPILFGWFGSGLLSLLLAITTANRPRTANTMIQTNGRLESLFLLCSLLPACAPPRPCPPP